MKYLIIAVLLLVSVSARAEDVWLVVGASDSTPAGIAQKWKTLGQGSGIIVHSRDCGDNKNVLAWAAHIESSATSARDSLTASRLPDGYIKRCRIQPGSLLAFRETAVDHSIADVPSTTVNWEDRDRLTTIHLLQGGRYIVISRYYSGNVEDALEGRRERVLLVGPAGERHVLQEDCVTPEYITAGQSSFAYQCSTEQAGDELLHKVVVYSMAGKKIKEVANCRVPILKGNGTVVCEKETVNADGNLHLQKIEQRF